MRKNLPKGYWNLGRSNSSQIVTFTGRPLPVLVSIYLAILFSFYVISNHLSSTNNSSYRISLQSIYGFGAEPSKFVIPFAALLVVPFIYFYRKSLIDTRFARAMNFFAAMTLPSVIVITLIILEILFGSLRFPDLGIGIVHIFRTLATGSPLTLLFIAFLNIFLMFFLTLFSLNRDSIVFAKSQLLSWLFLANTFGSYYLSLNIATQPRQILFFTFILSLSAVLVIIALCSGRNFSGNKERITLGIY